MIPTDEMVRVAAKAIARMIPTDGGVWLEPHGHNYPEQYSEKEQALINGIAKAALTAALAAMWQPIENADPDTPYFCFWKPLRDNVVTADNYGVAINAHGNWHNPDDRDDDYSEPSFYMPLPPAPTQLSTRGAVAAAQAGKT